MSKVFYEVTITWEYGVETAGFPTLVEAKEFVEAHKFFKGGVGYGWRMINDDWGDWMYSGPCEVSAEVREFMSTS